MLNVRSTYLMNTLCGNLLHFGIHSFEFTLSQLRDADFLYYVFTFNKL